jgi:hypothetical protein
LVGLKRRSWAQARSQARKRVRRAHAVAAAEADELVLAQVEPVHRNERRRRAEGVDDHTRGGRFATAGWPDEAEDPALPGLCQGTSPRDERVGVADHVHE